MRRNKGPRGGNAGDWKYRERCDGCTGFGCLTKARTTSMKHLRVTLSLHEATVLVRLRMGKCCLISLRMFQQIQFQVTTRNPLISIHFSGPLKLHLMKILETLGTRQYNDDTDMAHPESIMISRPGNCLWFFLPYQSTYVPSALRLSRYSSIQPHMKPIIQKMSRWRDERRERFFTMSISISPIHPLIRIQQRTYQCL
jgi:hypothetical protein